MSGLGTAEAQPCEHVAAPAHAVGGLDRSGAAVLAEGTARCVVIDVIDPQEEERESAARDGFDGGDNLQPRGCRWFNWPGPRPRNPRPNAHGVGARGPPVVRTR